MNLIHLRAKLNPPTPLKGLPNFSQNHLVGAEKTKACKRATAKAAYRKRFRLTEEQLEHPPRHRTAFFAGNYHD